MSAVRARRDPATRRAAVLDAAQSLFVEQGISATTVEQIAVRAGVAKGTVYLYFASKDEVAAALEERFTAEIVARPRAGAGDVVRRPVPEVVRTWCGALAVAYVELLPLHDVLFYGWAPPSRQAAADNPLITDLAAVLGARDWPDAEWTASFLVGGVTLVVDRVLHGGSRDEVAVLTAVQAVVDRTFPGAAS